MTEVMRRSLRAGGAFALAGLLPALAFAATIHVPADQPTIAAGLVAAVPGDTVVIACGIYLEHDIAYKSGVVVRSESGSPDCVTVDAQQLGRTFDCSGQAEVYIMGLTLGGGRHAGGGGAVIASGGHTVTLTDCVFTGSSSTFYGGGVYFDSEVPGSRLVVTGCRFLGNDAVGWDGAALNVHGRHAATVSIDGCVFAGNTAGYWGGAIEFNACTATVTATTFADNTALNLGGALFCTQSDVRLEGCTFVSNAADSEGGAIFMNGGTVLAAGCTFSANQAPRGGCLFLNDADLALDRTVLAFSSLGAAVHGLSATADARCCDVFGNVGGDFVGPLAGLEGHGGNFAADPIFCGAANPETPFTLDAASPCAADNNPECGQIGAWAVGCDATVAVEPDGLPAAARLVASPNPFNPATTIRFVVAQPGPVRLAVYDVAGNRVRLLADDMMAAGEQVTAWDGRGDTGAQVAAGTYVCRLVAGDRTWSMKLSLVK